MLHEQPDAFKHMCMLVELGYDPTRTTRRAYAFDCINIRVGLIEEELPTGDQGDAARAEAANKDMLDAVSKGDVVLIKFQAMRAEYTVAVKEDGVKYWKQSFVGEPVSIFGTVGGVIEREAPLFSDERSEFLHAQILESIVRPTRPPPT